MTGDVTDLPRGWLAPTLDRAKTADLEIWIAQAGQWGFKRPVHLQTNAARRQWLRDRRGEAWTLLQKERDGEFEVVSADVFPSKRRRGRLPARRGRLEPDLCQIPAAEVNEWLNTLPVRPFGEEFR
ncbi:hypothetical protein [Seohaeicola zhoushanensis]|uniref:Uncharacterized protein n=1 Tax=Seohaeicola zhoushanensis TaxID=1569283 RepID=A0A8J3H1H0_9RHOB|nr:hypothetical protein [Seohaeicola zhoushanensis]GHF71075.1 hypothetical protein GCM10017056_47490 [Seohaeicola zhoushanensis]